MSYIASNVIDCQSFQCSQCLCFFSLCLLSCLSDDSDRYFYFLRCLSSLFERFLCFYFLCFFLRYSLERERSCSCSCLTRAPTVSSYLSTFPSNLCGLSSLVVGFALISTLLLSKPKPIGPATSSVNSSLLPLIRLRSNCISAGLNFSLCSSSSVSPKYEFILSWSLLIASDISLLSISPDSNLFRCRYQSFFLHFPPLSSTPIMAELPRYISRSRQGISLTFSHSKSDQPPLLPPLMGTHIFLFSFSSRLVMTIKLIIRVQIAHPS